MSLEGKRVIVFAEDMYEDPELWYPYYRMIEAGRRGAVGGHRFRHDLQQQARLSGQGPRGSAEEISPDEVDGIIVPGGFAPTGCAATRPC